MNNILKREYIVKHRNHRRWYYTFECDKCQRIETKSYQKSTWTCLCKYCGKGGLSKEEFISKSKELYGDKYSYEKTEYVSDKQKLTITCRLHGDIKVRPSDHFRKTLNQNHINGGCKKCASSNLKEIYTLSIDVWKERLLQYPLLSLVSYVDIGYHKPVTLNCKLHGNFVTTFGSLSKSSDNIKYICRHCFNQSHRSQPMRDTLKGTIATLYLVYLPYIDMYKLGVTTQSLQERLPAGEFEVIYNAAIDYEQAISLEHIIHVQLSDLRYKGTAKLIRGGGNTELYKINILDKVLEIINRASLERSNVESYLNEEYL